MIEKEPWCREIDASMDGSVSLVLQQDSDLIINIG